MKKWWLIVFVFVSCLGHSQEEFIKGDLSFFAEGGYLVGGQITSNTFSYQSGVSFRSGIVKEINPSFGLGFGLGLDTYDYVEFYPVFLKVEAKFNSDKSGFFVSHLGYSFAHSWDEEELVEQEFEGGGFLELGRAWRFNINDNLELVSGVSLKHQFAVLELKNAVGDDLEQSIDFDGVHFRIGIKIK